MRNILTCTGYGHSGSSAFTNFFEEFNCVKSFGSSFECDFLFQPDGFYDLINILQEGNQLKTDFAFKRFFKYINSLRPILNKYFNDKFDYHFDSFLEQLAPIVWNSSWTRAESEFRYLYNIEDEKYKFMKTKYNSVIKTTYTLGGSYEPDEWHPSYYPFTKQYHCNSRLPFFHILKTFITNLFDEISIDNETDYILVDQLLPSANVETYLQFFQSCKCIIVDRDPRDLYLGNKLFWGNRWIPSVNVTDFIKWYKITRNQKDKEMESVKYVRFEDLIYNYENTKQILCNFLGFDMTKHTKQYHFFNPMLSKKNTFFWQRYSNYDNDIKVIERELEEHCVKQIYNMQQDINKKYFEFPIEKLIAEIDTIQEKNYFSVVHDFDFFLYLFMKAIDMDYFKQNIKNFNIRNNIFYNIYTILKIVIYSSIFPFLVSIKFVEYIKKYFLR